MGKNKHRNQRPVNPNKRVNPNNQNRRARQAREPITDAVRVPMKVSKFTKTYTKVKHSYWGANEKEIDEVAMEIFGGLYYKAGAKV